MIRALNVSYCQGCLLPELVSRHALEPGPEGTKRDSKSDPKPYPNNPAVTGTEV